MKPETQERCCAYERRARQGRVGGGVSALIYLGIGFVQRDRERIGASLVGRVGCEEHPELSLIALRTGIRTQFLHELYNGNGYI